MYSKLSIKNVRRSVRDYTIYFLTLTFGVCIFYVFNSIESQHTMLKISKSQYQILKNLAETMNYISIFIAVTLGFLIIYANTFLIKRRKKELGIYMTLGMEKGKISRILFYETIIIGIVSLAVGLILGIFISQGLSVVTAKMFEVDLKSFQFIFSSSACLKTILYFGIIFLLVLFLNSFTITKYKLINLINANKKNETLKVKKLGVSVVLFIISLIFIGVAYYLIIINGMLDINLTFTLSIVFGSIGTLLFFMSLSGFLLKMVQTNKKLYLKNLNIFILRQINSKINTTYISMTFICLMLLIAIGTLSTGMGINNALTKNLKNITPYDVSYYRVITEGEEQRGNIDEELRKHNFNIDKYSDKYSNIVFYHSGLSCFDIVKESNLKITDEIKNTSENMKIHIIKQSDYNKLMEQLNKKTVNLKKDEFAIQCNIPEMKETINDFIKNKGQIEIDGKTYKHFENKYVTTSILTERRSLTTIILPDEKIKDLKKETYVLNANYRNNIKNCEEKIYNELQDKIWDKHNIKSPFDSYNLKSSLYEENKGISITVSYLAIYIGVVFLITSVAILSLQQLSESADNIMRYKLLKKIGVEDKMINKSIFSQTAIYFIMPLFLAIIHSVVGINVANNIVVKFGKLQILTTTIFTAIIIIIVYGGYFLATYMGSKSMINKAK
ncbi:MAG: ABC transporter permease [Vallitalea sp.]|nr:ABC transporter permease [Vallitalea sp.]